METFQQEEKEMFNFRIIETADGNQIIDTTLKTPYESLTPFQMLDYMEVDAHMATMERLERNKKKAMNRRRKLSRNLLYKVACMVGLI